MTLLKQQLKIEAGYVSRFIAAWIRADLCDYAMMAATDGFEMFWATPTVPSDVIRQWHLCEQKWAQVV